MSTIAQELDAVIGQLDPVRAAELEQLVRDAVRLAISTSGNGSAAAQSRAAQWPEKYFENTAGAFADEPFERPEQGELPTHGDW